MSDKDALFLSAVGQLPRDQYPATNAVNAVFRRLDKAVLQNLPPHLHPLFVKLHCFCIRRTLALEKRLRLNPTFRLLLSVRIVPPEFAFMAAAASTVYALRYMYIHALDLLTNIVGIAYPAYQSILAIEYGDMMQAASKGELDMAMGETGPNLDKKQWLMYWAIYGVLTTADHWAGPILKLFPFYRVAKISVLLWAQHHKYNGAAWLYDTFVRPLLPPAIPATLSQNYKKAHQQRQRRQETEQQMRIDDVVEGRHMEREEEEKDEEEEDEDEHIAESVPQAMTFSTLLMPS
ncbi:hypothetical protein EC988_007061, partial [Linderina pennispora]